MSPTDSPPSPPESLTARVFATLRARGIGVKALSFALVGAVNFWVDFGVFSLAHLYFGWPVIISNVAAWVVAVTGSYVMNSLITFAAESGRRLRVKDYLTFAVSQLGGLVANTATVFVLSLVIPLSSLRWTLLVKLMAIGVSFMVNFALSHFVVFRHRSTTSLS